MLAQTSADPGHVHPATREIHLQARAKVNLSLDVLEKRADGFHEIRTVLQEIDLWDDVFLRPSRAGVKLASNRSDVPTGPENLAYRAALLMLDQLKARRRGGLGGGVEIEVVKRIPVGAGLGGGSTDAAAVLRGMNAIFDLGLSAEELIKLGVRLGADVPFFLLGGTSLAAGIGERLTVLPPPPSCTIILARPPFELSTAEIYDRWQPGPTAGPYTPRLLQALRSGNIIRLGAALGNMLEPVAAGIHPELTEIKDIMLKEGAWGASMTGSGSVVFGLLGSTKPVDAIVAGLKDRVAEFVVTQITRPAREGLILGAEGGRTR